MVSDCLIISAFDIVSAFEIQYNSRTVKAFRMFRGKRMINNYLLESKFRIEYVYGVVYGHRMGNLCWIESLYDLEYNFRRVKAFRIFIEKDIVKH